jgi:hypothetical protein
MNSNSNPPVAAPLPQNHPQSSTYIEMLKRQLETENQSLDGQNSILSQSTSELKEAIANLNGTHQNLRSEVDGFLNQIVKEFQVEDHLIKDVTAMAKANPQAAEALARIESNREEMKKQIEQTKESLGNVQKQLEDEHKKGLTLAEVNQQLFELHQVQVQKIKTNVDLLKALQGEITTLTEQAKRLKNETDPTHGYIRYYAQFPFLIKIRNLFMSWVSNNIQQGEKNMNVMREITSRFTTQVNEMMNKSGENIKEVINTLNIVNRTLSGVQQVAENKSPSGSSVSPITDFFPQYEEKISRVTQFWNSNDVNLFFVITWMKEAIPNVVLTQEVDSFFQTFKSRMQIS